MKGSEKGSLRSQSRGECDLGKEGSDRILLHPDSAITLASGRSALLVSLYIPHDETVTLKKFGRRMLCGGYHIKAARPAARRVTELGMGGEGVFQLFFSFFVRVSYFPVGIDSTWLNGACCEFGYQITS